MIGPSSRIFQEVLHRVLDAAGFGTVQRNGKERPYVRFHDLRHTFASLWVMKGGDVFRLQRILGHGSITMTQRYAHLAPDAFKDDYARLGRAIPEGGKVLALPTRERSTRDEGDVVVEGADVPSAPHP
jgi:integrase